jgi:hypothetical protein
MKRKTGVHKLVDPFEHRPQRLHKHFILRGIFFKLQACPWDILRRVDPTLPILSQRRRISMRRSTISLKISSFNTTEKQKKEKNTPFFRT